MIYASHKDIPAKMRTIILEETMATRVSQVTLATCNKIVADYLEQEKENAALKVFSVTIIRNGVSFSKTYTSFEDTLVAIDREFGYTDSVPQKVIAIIRQADRVLRAYINGKLFVPSPKDKVNIIRRSLV